MVSCDIWSLSSPGCVRFNQPAICSGDQASLSLFATMRAKARFSTSYRSSGDAPALRRLDWPGLPGSVPGHHYGISRGSPSTALDPATTRLPGLTDQRLYLGGPPRVPTASGPILIIFCPVVVSRRFAPGCQRPIHGSCRRTGDGSQ